MKLVLATLAAAALTATSLSALGEETDLVLDNGVEATLNMPEGAENVPAVLMLHGFASSKDEVGNMYAREAAALAEQGIASLRISFRGFGKSDGDTGATTIDQQLEDALNAAHYLRDLPETDDSRLGVLGFSLGGGIAILATAAEPDLFKSRVTWSSVGDFDTDMRGSTGEDAAATAREKGVVGLDLGFRTIALKAAFFDSLEAHDLESALAEFDGAFLTIAGSEDFSAAYAQRFVDAAPGEPKRAEIIEGGDHIFGVLGEDQAMAEGVIATTAEWFAETL